MKPTSLLIALTALAAFGWNSAGATILYNQMISPDVIYGSGNTNSNWATSYGSVTGGGEEFIPEGTIEVGLRAKLRGVGPVDGSGGVYTFAPGISSGTAALWNFDFHVNVNYLDRSTNKLGDFEYKLWLDTDPTAAQSWEMFNPLSTFTDNSLGNWDTGNGMGVETGDPGLYEVFQNSQNYGWFVPGFDPYASGRYDFKLQVLGSGGGDEFTDSILAETEMTVVVTPEPTTVAILGLGLLGLGVSGLRRRRNQA